MHDMDRDAVRERLPDLAHGQLSSDDAAAIEAAAASNADLAGELALLRRIRAVHERMPAVDVASIVAALPAPPQRAPLVDDLAVHRARRQPRTFTRFARAAALVAVLGGGTLLTWRARTAERAGTGAVRPPAESLATVTESVQLGLGAPTDDLSVDQLKALEADIQALDGMPSLEPDAGTDLSLGEGA